MTIWPDVQRVLSPLGDIASIVGLGLTVAVYFGVRRIKAFYLFRARIPALAEKLEEKASLLQSLVGDYATAQDDVQEVIIEVAVLARSIRDKSSGQPRTNANQVLRLIEKRKHAGAKGAREIYLQIQQLRIVLREIQLDLKWEK